MDAVADAVVDNLTMWVRDPVILHDYKFLLIIGRLISTLCLTSWFGESDMKCSPIHRLTGDDRSSNKQPQSVVVVGSGPERMMWKFSPILRRSVRWSRFFMRKKRSP